MVPAGIPILYQWKDAYTQHLTCSKASPAFLALLWTVWQGHPFTYTTGFCCKICALTEFLQPMLTDVLASPISIQIIHEICIASTSCIAVKIPSAVDEEHMHMSRNCELTTPRFSSNMQMVKRFALSTPVSLQPSMANANGSFYIKSTSICW